MTVKVAPTNEQTHVYVGATFTVALAHGRPDVEGFRPLSILAVKDVFLSFSRNLFTLFCH